MIAGWCFFAGILLFSGSLYALALSNVGILGAIRPAGGLLFLTVEGFGTEVPPGLLRRIEITNLFAHFWFVWIPVVTGLCFAAAAFLPRKT